MSYTNYKKFHCDKTSHKYFDKNFFDEILNEAYFHIIAPIITSILNEMKFCHDEIFASKNVENSHRETII